MFGGSTVRGRVQGVVGALGLASAVLAGAVPAAVADPPAAPSHRFTAISAALDGGHVCAVTTQGRAACWGRNDRGQLGTGDTRATYAPVLVPGLTGVRQIAAGAVHTCALLADSGVRCWGFNSDGELGNGKRSDSAEPREVLGPTGARPLRGVVAISAGGYHTCALLSDGGIDCWGEGSDGRLGNHAKSAHPLPVAVQDRSGRRLTGARGVTAGEAHTCAVLADRTLSCWGDNSSGQLGNGRTQGRSLVPVPVVGLREVATASAGKSHTCAVTTSGHGWCWGADELGQLGRGGHGSEFGVPQPVAAADRLTGITTGQMYTCATTARGSAQCWGDASYGELGNGVPFGAFDSPQTVLGLPAGARTITAGAMTSCAVVSTGAALCWGGANAGGGNALGDGDVVQGDRFVAVAVA